MTAKRFARYFEIFLIVLTVGSHLYLLLSPANTFMNWYGSDDAFYYFKVAQNIVSGHGVTFDGINPTNGFQPAWMVVCIVVFWLFKTDILLPLRILIMISTILTAGTGIILFKLLSRYISPVIAGLVSMLWIFLPGIHEIVTQNGMETGLTAFFLSLTIYLVIKWQDDRLSPGKLISLGFIAGLVILSRMDNIFVVMLLGVWFVFTIAGAYLRIILVGDLAVLYFAGLLSNYFGIRQGYIPDSSGYLGWISIAGFVITPLVLYACGLYTNRITFSRRILFKYALAFAITSGIISILLIVLRSVGVELPISGRVMVFYFGLVFLGTLFLRIIAWKLVPTEGRQNDIMPQPIKRDILHGVLIRSLGYFVPVLILLCGYFLWSYLYLGTPFPVSGQIKLWWGTLGFTAYGLPVSGFSELFGNSAWSLALSPTRYLSLVLGSQGSHLIPVLLKVVLLGLVLLLLYSQRKFVAILIDKLGLFVIFIGLYAQILSYTSTGYLHTRDWYWVGEMLFTVICAGILLQCLHRLISKNTIGERVWSGVIIVMAIGTLFSFADMVVSRFPYQKSSGFYAAYTDEVSFLETATQPGAVIGMPGGGTVAYFIRDRTIVNLDGLINSPEYFHLLRSGQGISFLNKMNVSFVYGSEFVISETDPYREMLSEHIIPIERYENNVLYRYTSSP